MFFQLLKNKVQIGVPPATQPRHEEGDDWTTDKRGWTTFLSFSQKPPEDSGMHTHGDVRIVQHVGCNHSLQTWVLQVFPEPACPGNYMVSDDMKRFDFFMDRSSKVITSIYQLLRATAAEAKNDTIFSEKAKATCILTLGQDASGIVSPPISCRNC